jgi:hypothetical protein
MNTLGIPVNWLFALGGLLAGVCVTWLVISQRATKREERLLTTAREQMAQGTQNLRQANAKLQADLDKMRAMAVQGQSAALAEQRALVLHLQSQLRAANMEMDRLQQRASPVVASQNTPEAAESDGFASTRPFER